MRKRCLHTLLGLSVVSAFASTATLAHEGQSEDIQIRPEQIEWHTNPAAPSAQSAILIGNGSKPGALVTRVRLPAGKTVNPHTHPEDRVYTVISGMFYIGYGNKFDNAKLMAFPAGSVLLVPGKKSHFHAAKNEEWVVQINTRGPTSFDYVNVDEVSSKREAN